MTTFHIKLLAILTMLIDHVGLFFFPDQFIFRLIGRLSFPLFAWLIANGAYHTRNIQNYFWRLVIFAIVSQVPFMLASRVINIEPGFNIFFTLSIGLGAIILIKKVSSTIYKALIAVFLAIIASVLNADYGAFGVLLIVLFYVFFKNTQRLIIAQTILFICNILVAISTNNSIGIIEIFGLLSLIIISFYNGREGVKMQYLFYLVYPLQYIVYYFLLMKR